MPKNRYTCAHRPQCHHYPLTEIAAGYEEWVRFSSYDTEMIESHHKDCITGLHYVARYGKKVSPYFVDENLAFAWLLRHQGQSVDWAVRHEGYRFEKVGN